MQRQYVDTFTSLLVVFTSRELQNGQATGADVAEVDGGGVYTRSALSAPGIVALSEPLLCHPLMTDAPEVHHPVAAQP